MIARPSSVSPIVFPNGIVMSESDDGGADAARTKSARMKKSIRSFERKTKSAFAAESDGFWAA